MRGGKGVDRRYAVLPMLALIWGFNWPAVKIALGEIGPWTMRAGGLTLGATALGLMALLGGQSLKVRSSQWTRLAAAGLLSVAGFNILLAFAQLSTSATRAAIVTFTMPVWTVVFARILLKEPLDSRRSLALGLGLGGLLAMAWPMVQAGDYSVGLLYALLAGISWALGTIVSKRFPVDAPPITGAFWQLAIAAGCAAAGMAAFEGVMLPHDPQAITIAAFLYQVLLAQALGYAMWFSALTRLPASTISLGTLPVPAVGVLGATLLLGETPTITDIIGLVLVVAAAAAVILPTTRNPNWAGR